MKTRLRREVTHVEPIGELRAAPGESEEPPEPAASPHSAEIAALYAQKQRLIEMLNSEKLDAELRALQAAARDGDDDVDV